MSRTGGGSRPGVRCGLGDDADVPRLAGHAADRPGLLQCLEVVLRGTHALEPEGACDLGLRRRDAITFDVLGNHGQDRLLGIGQVHG